MKISNAMYRSKRLSSLLAMIVCLFFLPACEESDTPPPSLELPERYLGEWRNAAGAVIFDINPSNITYLENFYSFTPSKISELDQFYVITLSEIEFFIGDGENSNEIVIGTNGNSPTVSTYYKEVEAEPTAYLPEDFMGHWYAENQSSYSSYFIASNYFMTSGLKFYYTEKNVSIDGNNTFSIVGTTDDNRVLNLSLKQSGEQVEIQKETDGFITYWDSPAVQLPTAIFSNWYNYDEVWRYDIAENNGDAYARVGNVKYFFSPRDVFQLDNEIFKVKGISSSAETKTFFLQLDEDGALRVSTLSDYESNFVTHWNSRTSIPKIDDFFYKKWFAIGKSIFTYRLFINEAGDYIFRTLENKVAVDFVFDPDKGDIRRIAENEYQITTTGKDGTKETYYIKRNGTEDNSILAATGSSSNYELLFHVTGRTIEKAEHAKGAFKVISGGTWGEYNDQGQLLWELQEIGRSDWEVRLEKWTGGDQIVISMHQKWSYYISQGTTEKIPMYELTGYDIVP